MSRSLNFFGNISAINASVMKIPSRLLHRSFGTSVQPEIKENEDTLLNQVNKDMDMVKENPLRYKDYFKVKELVKMKDLFEAGVHYGHKEGTLDDRMRPYIFGSRLGHLIIDLEQTAELLRDALNVTAHIAYRGGIILFASNYHQHCELIERTAVQCKEFANTRKWVDGAFTASLTRFQTVVRLPDLVIALNTLNDVLHQHEIISQAAKLNIPVVAIVDTNCNPNLITYPVPGNDDTPKTMEYYCDLFKTAILRGKEERKRFLEKNL